VAVQLSKHPQCEALGTVAALIIELPAGFWCGAISGGAMFPDGQKAVVQSH
jgi:hypothetical protein